jgi:hypothetical protein
MMGLAFFAEPKPSQKVFHNCGKICGKLKSGYAR